RHVLGPVAEQARPDFALLDDPFAIVQRARGLEAVEILAVEEQDIPFGLFVSRQLVIRGAERDKPSEENSHCGDGTAADQHAKNSCSNYCSGLSLRFLYQTGMP